ncbi:hypothetical protein ABEV34_26130 [Methylorubrum rhodesianum]|uniref:Uncharacterized protein n=1 Tax=Methylorubrum rhodesianum TaxID=29427 RepID=A0ABU9Z9U1_9HYPH|nr:MULTISPECIES: hypothetical protein [Methylorubrum]MBB5763260.1 hypothetical protein [Methylorubrum rhodesianum]MRI55250.1 hypothetical protein [Methylobacterium sp. DB1607]
MPEDSDRQRQDRRLKQAQIGAIGRTPKEIDDDLDDAEADEYSERNQTESNVELLYTDASPQVGVERFVSTMSAGWE